MALKSGTNDGRLSSAQTTENTPSVQGTMRRPSSNSRQRNNSTADTICSLTKKRTGILQRQASAISHVESN
eukprot:CAMPEP_0170473622 /NCGR_PEP_ID=MMETSP0123-20130129/15519_1 /TAXON_ID=182087 /ORGANISM="Favella ehrenbergii, Strain Fehren 1" /LENGTH=70 /DNA_ID=CAMNT_0010742809 /DNA_START=569 /DNA_END=778 /DNA_ORIENTATION=-